MQLRISTPHCISRRFALAVCLPLLLALHGAVHAQGYPARPVRLIVPFPPGGANDILARILGQKLGQTLGQNFIVDNRAGASGIIGTELVAKAAPASAVQCISPPNSSNRWRASTSCMPPTRAAGPP